MTDIAVVDFGVSNVGSVRNALDFLGVPSHAVTTPEGLKGSSHIVLPGDGSFPVGMQMLREKGLDQAIVEAAHRGVPLLGICLGMQLMAEQGEEFELTRGLELMCGHVVRMAPNDPY